MVFALISLLAVGGVIFACWNWVYSLTSAGLHWVAGLFNPGAAIPWWAIAILTGFVIVSVVLLTIKLIWHHPFATLFLAGAAIVIYFAVLPKLNLDHIFASVVPMGMLGIFPISKREGPPATVNAYGMDIFKCKAGHRTMRAAGGSDEFIPCSFCPRSARWVERTDERLWGDNGHEVRAKLFHAERLASEAGEA